jgi:hypothetical protein
MRKLLRYLDRISAVFLSGSDADDACELFQREINERAGTAVVEAMPTRLLNSNILGYPPSGVDPLRRFAAAVSRVMERVQLGCPPRCGSPHPDQ